MNLFSGKKSLDINQGVQQFQQDPSAYLVDVRTMEEYQEGHIPESINLPLHTLDSAPEFLLQTQSTIYLYCRSGARSAKAEALLKQQGIHHTLNIGGILDYQGPLVQSFSSQSQP